MLTRYEELDRKAYSLIAAAGRANSPEIRSILTIKGIGLITARNALTIEEAEAPAHAPNMGEYALI
jgi:hypothetical protein